MGFLLYHEDDEELPDGCRLKKPDDDIICFPRFINRLLVEWKIGGKGPGKIGVRDPFNG
jgi:hypothetical protein